MYVKKEKRKHVYKQKNVTYRGRITKSTINEIISFVEESPLTERLAQKISYISYQDLDKVMNFIKNNLDYHTKKISWTKLNSYILCHCSPKPSDILDYYERVCKYS
jgi:hypothetical protein